MPYAKEKQKIYQRLNYLTNKKGVSTDRAVQQMKHEEVNGKERPMNRLELIEKFGKMKLGEYTNDTTNKERLKNKKIGILENLLDLEDDDYVKTKIKRFIEYYEEQNDETSDNE